MVTLSESEGHDRPDDVVELIRAASAILPQGPSDITETIPSNQSAMGAKINALILVLDHVNGSHFDSSWIEPLHYLITAHLFSNTSFYEMVLMDSYFLLDSENLETSPKFCEPAFASILDRVWSILKQLYQKLSSKNPPRGLDDFFSPSFSSSLVDLLLSPIAAEQENALNLLKWIVESLDDSHKTKIISGMSDYLENLNSRRMPLRGVNGLLNLALLYFEFDLKRKPPLQRKFFDLIHSQIFPLYKNSSFYLVHEPYTQIIKLALMFYAKPEAIDFHFQSYFASKDYFTEHHFVDLCRTKFLSNLPVGHTKNQEAVVRVIDALSSIRGFFTADKYLFTLKSLARKLHSKRQSELLLLYAFAIGVDNFETFDAALIAQILHIIWSKDEQLSKIPTISEKEFDNLYDKTIEYTKESYQEEYIKFQNGSLLCSIPPTHGKIFLLINKKD